MEWIVYLIIVYLHLYVMFSRLMVSRFKQVLKYCNYYYFPIFVVAVIVMTLPVINVMAR